MSTESKVQQVKRLRSWLSAHGFDPDNLPDTLAEGSPLSFVAIERALEEEKQLWLEIHRRAIDFDQKLSNLTNLIIAVDTAVLFTSPAELRIFLEDTDGQSYDQRLSSATLELKVLAMHTPLENDPNMIGLLQNVYERIEIITRVLGATDADQMRIARDALLESAKAHGAPFVAAIQEKLRDPQRPGRPGPQKVYQLGKALVAKRLRQLRADMGKQNAPDEREQILGELVRLIEPDESERAAIQWLSQESRTWRNEFARILEEYPSETAQN